jgi:hypothetical protein
VVDLTPEFWSPPSVGLLVCPGTTGWATYWVVVVMVVGDGVVVVVVVVVDAVVVGNDPG